MPQKDKIKIPPIEKSPELGSTPEISSLSENISVPSPKPLTKLPPSPRPTAPILSNKPLTEHRSSITIFQGFTGTKPVYELIKATWDEIRNRMCSNIPTVLSDKKQGEYFVPCELKVAPLVGNTLERAKINGEPLTGKMRSKTHATESSLVLLDVDGLPEKMVKSAIEKIKTDGITFLEFTTFSHGSADKPGDRIRIIVPLDRSVSVEEYSKVWRGFDKLYFNGQIGKADSSGANMYQQQGTWCCHPDRRDQAKTQVHNAGVAKAEFLIKKGRVIQVPKIVEPDTKKSDTRKTPAPSKFSAKNIEKFNTANQGINRTYPISDADKIADSCLQIGKFRDSKGKDQSEPLWRDCLGVVGYCENGVDLCHDWSSGHPGYDRTETDKKVRYRLQVAPTTCHQFKKTNPTGCKGCTQTCHSPITLGWEKENPLAAMQQQFALIKTGGKLYMVDGENLTERTSQGLAKKLELFDLKTSRLVIGRAVVEQFPRINVSEVINDFMYSPQTVCFDGIEFNPKETSGNHLNLWVDPTINPRQGTWVLIEEFLLKVICNGDKVVYKYLLKYIAHALQRPEEKPGVMIIMIGGQGTGKGTFGRIFQKIWSATYLQINNIDAVTGHFNAALERSYFVFMDEALFAGNRRASDALKSLITEPIIQIEEKHQPSRQITSYHRFIAATNADHFKNTDRDDRRDITLRVSEERKGDHEYWNELNKEIENDGVEAMAYDLLAVDISTFNVRNKPDTTELQEQKLLSLDPFPRWWHECLEQGCLNGDNGWPEFVSTSDIIEKINGFSGGKFYQKPSARTVAKEMSKICPSAKQMQKQEQLGRSRGYRLPHLQQSRAEFEAYIGKSIQWEGDLEVFVKESQPIVTL